MDLGMGTSARTDPLARGGMETPVLKRCALAPMLFLAPCVLSSASTATDPLWTVDLVPHGFVLDEWSQGLPERMIAFSNDDEVVVLDQNFRESYDSTVQVFVLDARSGKPRDPIVAWTMQTSSGIFSVSGGGYAVLDEQGTSLYGPGFHRTDFKSSLSAEMVSPNGARLAARNRKNGKSVWVAIDPKTMTETGELLSDQPSISEIAIADIQLKSTGAPEWRTRPGLRIQTSGLPEITLPLLSGAERPLFVAEHALVLVNGDSFDVLSDIGEHLFTGSVGGDWHQFAGCRNGSRMALVQQRWSELRGIISRETITVFDLARMSPIWTTTNKKMGKVRSSGVALSPDCSLVAIRTGSLVRVFKLPT